MKLIRGNIVQNADTPFMINRMLQNGYVPYDEAQSDGAEKESIPSAASTRRKTTKKKVNA